MQKGVRQAYATVLVVVCGLLWIGSCGVPLMDPDESRFARTSVEMLRSGDLVVPRFEGQPRLVKPPLMHWIQIALFQAFGVHEWVARLHSALATLGAILLTGWIARRRYGDEGAVWAVACMSTMPLVPVIGRVATLDALLALHVLAVIALDLAGPREPGRFRGLAVGALLGMAFLIKGPVGVVLPLVVALSGRTAVGREVLPSLGALAQAAASFAAVVLPWGLMLAYRIGADEIVRLLRTEALERYFAGTDHVRPFWFYGIVLVGASFPWLAPLAGGIFRAARRLRDPAAATAVYSAAGLLGGVVFFSLGKGKLPNYILPLMPLAALVVAWEIGQYAAAPRKRLAGPAALTATLGLLAAGFAAAGLMRLDGPPRTAALAGALAYGSGTLIALTGLSPRRPRRVAGAAALAAAVFLAVTLTILPAHLGTTRSTARLIEVAPVLDSGRPVVIVEMKLPSLTFYLDRIPENIFMPDLAERLARDDDPVFVLADIDLPDVPEPSLRRLQMLASHGKYRVFGKAGRFHTE